MKKRIPNPYSPEEVRQAFAQTNRDLDDNYLPYVGAAKDLDMGVHSVEATDITINGGVTTVDYIQFDLNHTCEHIEGRLHWNAEDGVLEHGLPGGNNCMQAGQTLLRCRNNSGATILDGKVVCACGAHVGKPTISLADITSHPTTFSFGVTLEDIANNSFGYVIMSGLARNIDTSAVAEGTLAYLSDITPGEIASSLPSHPNGILSVGMVMKSHANEGIIFCDPTFIPYMFTLPDVKHVAPSVDGEFYRYVAANSRFELANDSSVDHGGLTGLADDDHTQYVLYTGAHTDVDLGTHNLTTTGQVNAINVGTRTNGSAYLGLNTGDGPLSCVYVGGNAGENNTGQGGVFAGSYAGKNCEDEFATMVGYYAGRDSNGTAPVLVGPKAGQNQEGDSVIIFGNNAGYRNKAGNVIIVGYLAGQDNHGGSSIILGYRAGENNAGGWANIAGYYSGECSTSPYANLFGYRAGQFTEGWGTIAIGYEANGAFIPNTAGNKNFNSSVVDVDTDRITIPTHGFASIGTYFNLLYTEGSAPITGLSDGQVYQFKVIDADTIEGHGTQILVAGSGISHTFTPQYRYDNTICIGYQTSPTKSNQMILGGSDISETLIRGTVILDSNNQAIAFGDDGEADSYIKWDGANMVLFSAGDIDFSGCSLINFDIDHGGLTGLADDDHSHYHNDTRGDARYYTQTLLDAGQLDTRYFTEAEHINVSAGAGDAGKPILLDASGYVDGTMLDGELVPASTANSQIYQSTGVGTAAWVTDITGLTSLVVDNLTIDGAEITSDTGEITLGNDTVTEGHVETEGGVGTGPYKRWHAGSFQHNVASEVGTMKIRLPHVMDSSRVMYRIEGYNYHASARGKWTLNVGGFSHSTGWLFSGGTMSGDAPFTAARLAYDGTGACLLLGDEATSWARVEMTVDFTSNKMADATVTPTLDFSDDEVADWTITLSSSVPFSLAPGIELTDDGNGGMGISISSVASDSMLLDGDEAVRATSGQVTIYVRKTGSDTNEGYSSGDAFLTVARAIDELYIWAARDTVTVDIGAGHYDESALIVRWPYGGNLKVAGDRTTITSSCAISNIGSITSDSPHEYVALDITLPVGESVSVGDHIIVTDTADTVDAKYLVRGCHRVYAWDGGTRKATIRCYYDLGSGYTPVNTTTVESMMLMKTVLQFASGTGVQVSGAYSGGQWDDLVLYGNVTSRAVWSLNGGSITLLTHLGINNWGTILSTANAGVIYSPSITCSRSHDYTVAVAVGSTVEANGILLTGASGFTLYAESGSTIRAQECELYGNGSSSTVFCEKGGFIDVEDSYLRYGNSTYGAQAVTGGGIDCTGCTFASYATDTTSTSPGYVIV